jgi:ATP-binding cassette subfamily F protein 3
VEEHSSERVETLAPRSKGLDSAGDADKKQRKQEHARRREEQKRRRRLEKEVEELERQVTELEQRQTDLEQELADPQLYADQARFNARTDEHAQLCSELEMSFARWEAKQQELEE